jgi:CheY-like chemotaxis protein
MAVFFFVKSILLVEDSQDDIFIMERACKRTGIPHALHVVTDGQLGVEYLSGSGPYSDRAVYPMPHVVFLDIKMPNRDGHEVLQWIREQPGLQKLPVVMLTSSTHWKDVERAYELGVTSYLQKVSDIGQFGQAVRVILKYWLELNISANEGKSSPVESEQERPLYQPREESQTAAVAALTHSPPLTTTPR